MTTPRKIQNDELAFGVVVLAAFIVFIVNFATHFKLETALIVAVLMLVFTGIGIFGSRWLEKKDKTILDVGYVVVEILLGMVIMYFSEGSTWLIMLPLVSAAVERFPRVWMYVTCVIIWASQMLILGLLGSWQAVVGWGMALLAAIFFVGVFTQMTVNESKARSELAEANLKLREYAVQAEELAVARERNRLAREIHDGLGHYLTAINIQIKAAAAVSAQDPRLAGEALSKAQSLAEEALADVRRSVSALRADPSTSRPLSETLALLLGELKSNQVQTQFVLEGAPRPLDPQADFTFYRAAQEGITNVRKHANARKVVLTLTYGPRSVRLVLRDDGVGAEDASGGFGLVGLRERAELLGGVLSVETAPGQGFNLALELPTVEEE